MLAAVGALSLLALLMTGRSEISRVRGRRLLRQEQELQADVGALLVGDVSGHGREALAPTALVHYTVRAYLEAGLAPRTVLGLTDEVIGKKLGGSFATVLAAIYDPNTSTLSFATAGHPVPLVLGHEPDDASATLTPDRTRTAQRWPSDQCLDSPTQRHLPLHRRLGRGSRPGRARG